MDHFTWQFITFAIGNEEYGVDAILIREIKGWSETTALPEMPTFVRGVINLRGVIVPIFDLRSRLGGTLTITTPRHVIIVISVHDHLIGVLVDAVVDIVTISPESIQPVPEINTTAARFLEGIVPIEGRMVSLLNLDELFDVHAVVAADRTATTASPVGGE